MSENKNTSQQAVSSARRRLLSALAITGGGSFLAKSLPDRWLQPVVDTVILPAHAQITGSCSGLSCHVRVFDTGGGSAYDESIDGPATVNVSLGVSSDGTFNGLELRELSATLCEAEADVTVTLTIDGIIDNGLTCTLGSYAGPIDQDTDSDGVAAFADLTGGSVADGCSWVLTFSAPGHGECGITLNFTA